MAFRSYPLAHNHIVGKSGLKILGFPQSKRPCQWHGSFSGADGNFGVGKSAAVGNTTLGLADGKDYSVYLMIFDTAAVTDSSKFFVTEAKDLSTYSGADDLAQVKWGSQAGATSWASVSGSAVPEPTSGLLMLVGLAGLALRRGRRA